MSVNGEVVKLLKAHFPYEKFSVEQLNSIEQNQGAIITRSVMDGIKVNEEVIAYLVLGRKVDAADPIAQRNNSLYIKWMGVKKNYRGQGFGKEVVKDALMISKTRQQKLYTYVANFNTASLQLLLSYGFQIIGSMPAPYWYKKYKQVWLELQYIP